MPQLNPPAARHLILGIAALILGAIGGGAARADSLLLIELQSGKVLHAENATQPWHPASLTKLMTSYVALQAVREGRLKLDSELAVSAQATAQHPSKMGFPVGTKIALDDALKILMVKSANDIAVVVAEGVSGSVEKFAAEMNIAALRLGMKQSHFSNPNGLPDDVQVSSARDMAILTRALIREFPEYNDYWGIPAIKFGRRVMRNHNRLIGRYPGADGMKTGFICASGYNLVATASRDGKRLIAVVLGAPSSRVRAFKAVQMLERGFSGSLTSWLTPSLGTVDALVPMNVAPANLKDEICGGNRKRRPSEDSEEEEEVAGGPQLAADSPLAVALSHFRTPETNIAAILSAPAADAVPIVVRVTPPERKAGKSKVVTAEPATTGKVKKSTKKKKPKASKKSKTAKATRSSQANKKRKASRSSKRRAQRTVQQ